MKKMISALLMVLMILSFMASAGAENDSRSYDFILTSDGEKSVTAEKDNIITVTLSLRRTDSEEKSEVSAFQTELCYDDGVLEYVGNSSRLPAGVEAVDLDTGRYGRRLRVSYALDEVPSALFEPETEIMSFDFKVLKEIGASKLTQESYLVSTEDGTDTYESTAEEFTAITEKYFVPEYSVVFETMNGEAADEVLVTEGETISEPESIPVRNGYNFSGWFKDESYTEKYDFSEPVEGSMTLYAKWDTIEKPISPWLMYAAAAPLVIGLLLFILLRKKAKEK